MEASRRWNVRVADLEARHDLSGLRVAIKILNKRKMKNKNMISKVIL
jgi:hypothetical protein